MDEILEISEEYINKYSKKLIDLILAFQIILFILTEITQKNPFLSQMVMSLWIIIIFFVSKEFVEDDFEKKKLTSKFLLEIGIIGSVGIVGLFTTIASKFSNNTISKSFFTVNYIFVIFFAIAYVYFLNKDEVKSLIEILTTKSFLKGLIKRKIKPGDLFICTDIETGEAVIVPRKDRYLHFLILGPTGSGKTSQSIIPMINQDMQNLKWGITVIEPKGDLAEKIDAMGKYYGRPVIYFNPIFPNCPYFNPLYGPEDQIIENMSTTFKMLNPDSPTFFLDLNDQLIRNALKVLKRLKGNNATLIDLGRLVQNSGGIGKTMVTDFAKLPMENEAIAKENADIAQWFLTDYLNPKSKTYDNCSGVRSQISKINSNKYLRKVLNPPDGMNDIDFDKHLAKGTVIAITTNQGLLGDLSKFLGYFIILQFQSAVFRRPGRENQRRDHTLYIDEFQTYSTPGFSNMLTQGRSYRVSSVLATQNRDLMAMGGGKDGEKFVELVSTNARNTIIYPGGNNNDCKYYSEQFGEITKVVKSRGVSRSSFSFMGAPKAPTETIQYREETVARFSPSDIRYRKFTEITYSLIQKNTLQFPGVGKIKFIDDKMNETLDKMVDEYKEQWGINIMPEDDDNADAIIKQKAEEAEAINKAIDLNILEEKQKNEGKDKIIKPLIITKIGEKSKVSNREEHVEEKIAPKVNTEIQDKAEENVIFEESEDSVNEEVVVESPIGEEVIDEVIVGSPIEEEIIEEVVVDSNNEGEEVVRQNIEDEDSNIIVDEEDDNEL